MSRLLEGRFPRATSTLRLPRVREHESAVASSAFRRELADAGVPETLAPSSSSSASSATSDDLLVSVFSLVFVDADAEGPGPPDPDSGTESGLWLLSHRNSSARVCERVEELVRAFAPRRALLLDCAFSAADFGRVFSAAQRNFTRDWKRVHPGPRGDEALQEEYEDEEELAALAAVLESFAGSGNGEPALDRDAFHHEVFSVVTSVCARILEFVSVRVAQGAAAAAVARDAALEQNSNSAHAAATQAIWWADAAVIVAGVTGKVVSIGADRPEEAGTEGFEACSNGSLELLRWFQQRRDQSRSERRQDDSVTVWVSQDDLAFAGLLAAQEPVLFLFRWSAAVGLCMVPPPAADTEEPAELQQGQLWQAHVMRQYVYREMHSVINAAVPMGRSNFPSPLHSSPPPPPTYSTCAPNASAFYSLPQRPRLDNAISFVITRFCWGCASEQHHWKPSLRAGW
jgi:hypothetical protein